MKTSIPWGRSLLIGVLATVALTVCTPVWILCQAAGPVAFSYFWLVIGGPALLLALFIAKTRSPIGAAVCGIAFSFPIAAFCWILPTLDFRLDYFKEMRGDAVATVIASVILMVVAAFQRQLGQPGRGDEDHKSDGS